MAMGTELVFVLDRESLIGLLDDDLRAQVEAESDPEDLQSALVSEIGALLQPKLHAAHRALLESRFGPVSPSGDDWHVAATTPAGARRFSLFCVAEYGLEDASNLEVGISIWGRYWPVWADWRHERGGSGWNIPVDAELLAMAEQARTALARVLPPVGQAPLTVIECFY